MEEKTEGKIGYRVIDNFLPQKEFLKIETATITLSPNLLDQNQQYNIGWVYTPTVAHKSEVNQSKYFYMSHLVYLKGIILSPVYDSIVPVLDELEVKALMRIKCNLYPNQGEVHEHEPHVDFEFPHKAAILYINTCDGYTKLADDTKIDSVANRILLFDASTFHCSTTCNDQKARFNINFNYF